MKQQRWLKPRRWLERRWFASPSNAQEAEAAPAGIPRRRSTWIDRASRALTRKRDPQTAKWNRRIGAAGMALGAALMAVGLGPIGLAVLFLFLVQTLFATRR